MSISQHIPRRAFLTATGLVVAGAAAGAAVPLLGPRTAAAHDATCSCLTSWSGVWSVAKVGGKYLALAGLIDAGTLEIRRLDVAADKRLSVGARYTVDFPAGFLPSRVFGFGDRFLVGGGVEAEAGRVTVDYTADPAVLASPYLVGYSPEFDSGIVEVPMTTLRPALFEVVGRELREIPLGAAVDGLGWGHVSDLAAVSSTGLVALLSGSNSFESAYGERIVVADSADGGNSWTGATIAAGLGESWPATLTVAGDTLLATAVGQGGWRTFLQRPLGSAQSWTPADAGTDGQILSTVAGRDGAVVFDADGDRIRRRPWSTKAAAWAGAPTDARLAGQPVHAVLTIGGAPAEWIAVTRNDARLVTEA
jgi:hypothetical protein